MLRAVVIEDIETIREEYTALIRSHCPSVTVVGQADSVASGVQLIRELTPDLIFLDIDMPDGTGFDLLQQLAPVTFKVIFITGHEGHAVRAFRFSAIDYLLKPLDAYELTEAVKKVEGLMGQEVFNAKLANLFANMERPKDLQKLILKTADRIYSVHVQDIVHCESDKNYTTFHFINAPKLVVSTNLKEYDTILSPHNFFRTHQSHLINMAYFDHYVKANGGNTIVLKNKQAIPLSVRKKDEFMELLKRI